MSDIQLLDKIKNYDKDWCYQYQKRLDTLKEDMKRFHWTEEDVKNISLEDFEFEYIESKQEKQCATEFIKRYEWLGTIGSYPTHWFTARYKSILGGVIIMSMPNSFSKLLGEDTKNIERLIARGASASRCPFNLGSKFLMWAIKWMVNNTDYRLFTCYSDPQAKEMGSICFGICGKEYSDSVYELNRLCRIDDWKEPLSKFVAWCLRELKKENWIIVSYSDTAMNHHGYIYQACNFMYTGFSAKRADYCAVGNKHPRHRTGDRYTDTNVKKIRSPKHRYVYFCTNNKKLKKSWQKSLSYPIMPYPKGDNSNYVLGEYLEDSYVDNEGIEHKIYKANNYKYKKKLF